MSMEDLPLMERWLGLPEINDWYAKRAYSAQEVRKKYGGYIRGDRPVKPYLILQHERPVGYLQEYRLADVEEYRKEVNLPGSALGIDLFVAEPGRGYAHDAICERAGKFFEDEPGGMISLGPEPNNARAIKTYERVGFRPHSERATGLYGEPELLMTLEAEDLAGSRTFLEGRFSERLEEIHPEQLQGLFEGWPQPPTRDDLHKTLQGSAHVILAVHRDGRVVGLINALSDGHLAAFISMLEVHSKFRSKGIGSELVRRMLRRCESYRMVDLACDPDLEPFYRRFGLQPLRAMSIRHLPGS
jgi:ribosomal protein S18 acetylase RimI-like enzyme